METIVAVEDEPHILDNVTDLLEASSYNVVGATNAEEALQHIHAQHPDLILCDIMLPDGSGHDVLERVREEATLATTPFIFLTAKSTPDDLRDGMTRGADDYITKPFQAQELLDAIEARLDRHDAHEQKREEQLNDLRQSISTIIPHELRTPLGGIKGFAQFLKEDWDHLARDEAHEMIDHILEAADRLERVTENYSLYAQLEAEQTQDEAPTPSKGVSASVVAEAAREQAAAHERAEDLAVTLASGRIGASETHLTKATRELVDNAFKFSPAGTEVTVQGEAAGDGYVLRVQDQGRGMAADQVERIGAFEQFDRADQEQQGLGLGLVLVQQIGARYGGTCTIDSTPGTGTVVELRLPREV